MGNIGMGGMAAHQAPDRSTAGGFDQQRGMPRAAVRQGYVAPQNLPPRQGRRPANYSFRKGRTGKFTVTRRGA